MRIIAGIARRTPLVAPRGLETRPTSDISREGLFNILSQTIRGARFLDLFCGSGAVGIEALSRGAEFAVFVDCSRAAKEATLTNLTKTKLIEKSDFFLMDVKKATDNLQKKGERFDFIFLDPPYENLAILNETLNKVECLLMDDGIVIAEMDKKVVVNVPETLELVSLRNYGKMCFVFLKKANEGKS